MITFKKSLYIISQPPYIDAEEKKCNAVAIDQFPSQSFMTNENGFIANDILVFEEAQSDSVARAALSRIQVLNPQNDFSGMSADEILHHVVPSNFSSPAEYVRLQQNFAKYLYEKQSLMAAKKASKDTIEFDKTEVPKDE